ncbi:MAG: alpha/beta fold hydrolase [Candidatus Lustribacter sp.]
MNIPPEELQYGFDVAGLDPQALGEALQAVINESMSDPLNATMWMSQMAIAQQSAGLNLLRRLNGGTENETSAATKDKRFADPGWKRNPFFLGFAEAYLEQARAAMALVESSRLPEATRRKAKFAMQLMCDAFAPSNVPWLNPAVLREAMETGGMSLVRGMQNFTQDLRDNDGMPRQVDTTPFKLGVNLAATPGRIVFRNALIELIAYEPQTAQVHEIPLLCSPPWINKYYVMDLAPGRSFIEWAVLHGHQTFAISYRNPDASMASLQLEDYLRDGILAALGVVERITGRRRTNIAALCLGGTMTVLAMAYLAARGEGDRIASATLTNTLVDFSEPGELGVFTDESSIARLEKAMGERGYLESTEMAGTFNWMRANDLVWSYVVNNWFQGKNPPAFDILAWNADSTRMPAEMHSQYLRACYLRNSLVEPGRFAIGGVPIDLGAIANPLYVVGAETDHIAPWRSAYRTIQVVGSNDVRFTLTNSGHIAGIVNPPGGAKSEHWTLDEPGHDRTADEWRAAATRHAGTWWEDWAIWADAHAGPMVEPAKLPPGEAAPGAYVRNETAAPYDPLARKRPARKRKRA